MRRRNGSRRRKMREEGDGGVLVEEEVRTMMKSRPETKKGRSGSAPCPESTCVLVSPGRRIAARLFTNPSSTRLPELPLGTRPPSLLLAPSTVPAESCSLSSTLYGF